MFFEFDCRRDETDRPPLSPPSLSPLSLSFFSLFFVFFFRRSLPFFPSCSLFRGGVVVLPPCTCQKKPDSTKKARLDLREKKKNLKKYPKKNPKKKRKKKNGNDAGPRLRRRRRRLGRQAPAAPQARLRRLRRGPLPSLGRARAGRLRRRSGLRHRARPALLGLWRDLLPGAAEPGDLGAGLPLQRHPGPRGARGPRRGPRRRGLLRREDQPEAGRGGLRGRVAAGPRGARASNLFELQGESHGTAFGDHLRRQRSRGAGSGLHFDVGGRVREGDGSILRAGRGAELCDPGADRPLREREEEGRRRLEEEERDAAAQGCRRRRACRRRRRCLVSFQGGQEKHCCCCCCLSCCCFCSCDEEDAGEEEQEVIAVEELG